MARHLLLGSLLAAVLVFFGTGCATKPKPKPKPPVATAATDIRKLEVAGVKLGDGRGVLRRFGQAKRIPDRRAGIEVYEIYKPNAQISMLILTFEDGRVRRMELRYFNGPTEQTLRTAGGWDGLRDYLIKRFGPPSRTGSGVPMLTDMRNLNPAYARFNGIWNFDKIYRRIHYIALADSKGGVGVVTFVDTTPREQYGPPPATPTAPTGPNPGF